MHTRIRGSNRLGPLVVAIAAAVALAACGSSASSSSSGSAQSLLKQTFSSGHTVKSGVLGFSLKLTPTGSSTLTSPISLSLTGPFQSHGTGKLPASNFTISVSALGKQGSFGVISTGTNGYVSLEGANYQLPQADFQRLESSFASVESSSGSGAANPGLSQLGIDPLHWLKSPSIVGTESIGGAATTHIRASVDVAALLSDLNKFLAKTAKTTGQTSLPTTIPAATESKIAAAVKNATVDIWTGKSDTTLRKLSINLTLPVSGQTSTLLGGLSSAGIGLSLQYSGLGQNQTIAAPSNVQPYSGFTAKLQGVVQKLEGTLGGSGLGAGSSSSAGSGTTTQGAAPSSATPANVSKYTKCIQKAAGDVTKMQTCASLLNGQ